MRNLNIKVSFNGEIRRIDFSGTFQTLRDHITMLFGIESFVLKYRDVEGDLITLASDMELHHAVDNIASAPLRLEVFPTIGQSPVPVQQPPSPAQPFVSIFTPQSPVPVQQPPSPAQFFAPAFAPQSPAPVQQIASPVQPTAGFVQPPSPVQQPVSPVQQFVPQLPSPVQPYSPVQQGFSPVEQPLYPVVSPQPSVSAPQTYVPPFAGYPASPQFAPDAPQPFVPMEVDKDAQKEKKDKKDKKEKKDKKDRKEKKEKDEKKEKKDKEYKKDKERYSKEEWAAMKAQRKAEHKKEPKIFGTSYEGEVYLHSLIFSDPQKRMLSPGEAFTEKWRVKNAGTAVWPAGSVVMAFVASPKPSTHNFSGPESLRTSQPIGPDEEYEFSIDLVAPNAPGKYVGVWKFCPAVISGSPAQASFKGGKVKVVVKVPTPEQADRLAKKLLKNVPLSADEKAEIRKTKDEAKEAKKAAKLAHKENKRQTAEYSVEEKQQYKEAKRAAKLAKKQAGPAYRDRKVKAIAAGVIG